MRHRFEHLRSDLLSAGLKPDATDEQLYWAAQTLSIMMVAGVVVSLLAALLYVSYSALLFWAHVANAAGFLGAYLRFRSRPDPKFTIRVYSLCVFTVVFIVNVVAGGVASPAIDWFVPPALASALILGWREAWIWIACACLAVATLLVSGYFGLLPASPVPSAVVPVAEAIYAIMFMLVTGMLFSMWVARQRSLKRSLRNSLQRSNADTATARLFAEAAAAANGSLEFAQAARRCLELVCAHEDWCAAHVWLATPDGALLSTDIAWQPHACAGVGRIAFAADEICPGILGARRAHDALEPLIDDSPAADARLIACSEPPRCVLAWPVDTDGTAEIVLEFFSNTAITLDDELRRILEHVGRQIAHVRLREKVRDHTEMVAFTDPVTRLPNRIGFEHLFEQKLKDCARDGGRLALLFVDLDGFKRVNDSLGHAVGDLLLRSIGRRLEEHVRASDVAGKLELRSGAVAARLGGDEFTLVLADVDEPGSIAGAARRFLEVLAEPVDVGFQEVTVGASIGIAIYPDDGSSLSELMRIADAAMYEAKALPGNQFRFATPALNDAIARRLWVEAELRQAIRRDELQVSYAPIQVALTGRTIANELFLRWPHRDGEIAAEEFVAVAETSGLVAELGYWTIEKACAAISTARWSGGSVSMCVDISLLNLQQPNFVETVAAILARHDTPRAKLEFEFADTGAILKHEVCRTHIRRLHEMGIRIVLDRFGIGYSSLIDLARLPVWRIKLDRAFIETVSIGDDNQPIGRAIIAMAHSMGIETTIYGVETAAHAAWLRKLGCDALQGNWVGKPADAPYRKRARSVTAVTPTILDTKTPG